jgi:heme oxygenase
MRQLAARLSDTSAAILRALQDSQEKWNNIMLREASTSPSSPSLQSIQKQLPDDLVRQCFLEVLGREPESQQLVDYHAMFENTAMLKKFLMNSDEFRTKLAVLPEPARIVYQQYLLVRGAC